MTTGQRIRTARKKAGMTQAELAAKLEIPFQSVSQWERDIRNPKYDTIRRIATALGVEWTDLVPEEEQASTVITHIKERLKENSQWAEFMATYAEKGYEFTAPEAQLVSAFNKLNLNGQGFVITMTESMTKMPHYMQCQETPPEAPQDPPEGE